MKITDPGPDVLRAATAGDLTALDQLLLALQPGVFNLAVRMLGHRDDAADATQEILLKVVTHLSSFRREAAFSTWVHQIARNHLMTAATRSAESPEVSLDALAERLQVGLEFVAALGQDKAEAREVALGCTQSMLMAFDRDQRLIYVLDTLFDLSSQDAAEVVGITPEAYRQRLSRTRVKLDAFMGQTCGLVSAEAACRCEKQLPAVRHLKSVAGAKRSAVLAIHPAESAQAERLFEAFVRVGNAAAVFRAHPDYQAPESIRNAIRAVLGSEGFLDGRPLQ
jgi:RNA polymerase sigma factor (sigma-70 family)